MKKLFSISFLLIVYHFMGQAQNTRIGFTCGTTFANFNSKENGETDNANSIAGITAGIIADIPTGKHFSFQPAINFVQKGAKDEPNQGEKLKLTVNCIEVPLNLLYNSSGNKGNFFVGAGPSVTFAVSGKGKYDDGSNAVSVDLHFGKSQDDIMKGLDLGANFVTGYTFHSGFLVSLNFNAGLSNLSPGESGGGTLKSYYAGLKLGYLLKSKRKK